MSEKRHVRELVVVEGKCDISAVKSAVDCDIVETRGFGVYNNRELAAYICAAAGDRGVVILTDSDRAGFKIRSHLKSILGKDAKQAYIPQVKGKEKRKTVPSRDGLLGVEAMSAEQIIKALEASGATFDDSATINHGRITKADMYAVGLTGKEGSAEARKKLLQAMELPAAITSNALLTVLNLKFSDPEELSIYLSKLK